MIKKIFKNVTVVLLWAVLLTSIPVNGERVEAAENYGIVKGSNIVDVETSNEGTLSNGQSYMIKIKNSILTIEIGNTEYVFYVGNIKKTTDVAVMSEDDILQIGTLGGVYYYFDAYTGVAFAAYRNALNGKYCNPRNKNGYLVYEKSFINNSYFYESIKGSNSVSRERFITRKEFEIINNGGDPSEDQEPTPAPTQVPTVAPTQVPTVAPTQVPTVAPTQVPTVAPTQVPTVAPTQVPTVAPTQVPTPTATPDIKVDTDVKFDINFWYTEYTSGKITWEQFTKIASTYGWKIEGETVSKTVTDRVFDANGNCTHEETYTVTYKKETGNGQSNTEISNNGKADYEEKTDGKGEVTGEVKKETNIYINKTSNTTSKSKTTYHVRRSGNWVNLTRTVNGKTGSICKVYFNKKKKIVKFDGITYKKINYAGYTSSSKMIVMKTTKGKIKIAPRAKGKVGKTYKVKTLKGTWKHVIEGATGKALRVSNGKKVMGISNAQPQKTK